LREVGPGADANHTVTPNPPYREGPRGGTGPHFIKRQVPEPALGCCPGLQVVALDVLTSTRAHGTDMVVRHIPVQGVESVVS
jgi:hypothetical protein